MDIIPHKPVQNRANDLLYEKCSCGNYILNPIENMKRVGLLVAFLCCDDCVEIYEKENITQKILHRK